MADTSFQSYLQEKLPLVESWLKEHAWRREPASSEKLDNYLYAPLAHFNEGGGKRVRPVLALLSCEALGAAAEQALSSACAIELFQSAALIHDDIADEGEYRRGEPCLHKSLGLGLAINVGDAGLISAADAVLSDTQLGAEQKLNILREFTQMERRTLEGQALDLGWVSDALWDVNYPEMATLKTAHYSCASPLVIGALCAGARENDAHVEALRSFGLKSGLAFQIKDDLLNLVGDSKLQGKDFRSDISEGKRTYMAVLALKQLSGTKRERLLELLSSKTADEAELAEAVALMEEAGALRAAEALADELIDEACGFLNPNDFELSAYNTLISMAHFFIERAR